MKTARHAWKALFLVCLAVFAAFVSVFAVPPLMGDLVQRFKISYSQAGLFMTAYTVVPATGSLVVGWITDRVGIRRAASFGLVLIGFAGYYSAVATSYEQMLICRVLIGIGATSIFVPGLAKVLYVLPANRVNLATGAFFGSLNLGLSFALLITPVIAQMSASNGALAIYATFAMIVAALFYVLARNNPAMSRQTETPPVHVASQQAASSRFALVLVCGGNFLLFFQSFGMITWLPEYLKAGRNYSPAEVGVISMLLGLIVIPGSILAGWWADRGGGWVVAITGAVLCAIGPVLLISAAGASRVAVAVDVFLVSLGTALLTIPLTSVLSQIVSVRHGGKAVGAILTTGYSGAIASTYLGGYLITRTGAFALTFDLCSISMVIAVLLLLPLRETYRDIGLRNDERLGTAA